MYNAPQQCPTCGSALQIQELACPTCSTIVRGRWAANPFSRLTDDQQTFLLLFVRSRGNLSDVERTLGVSYPTVRGKLEDIIAALEEPEPEPEPVPEPAPAPAPSTEREKILERIARGELTVDEGMAQLRRLQSGGDAR